MTLLNWLETLCFFFFPLPLYLIVDTMYSEIVPYTNTWEIQFKSRNLFYLHLVGKRKCLNKILYLLWLTSYRTRVYEEQNSNMLRRFLVDTRRENVFNIRRGHFRRPRHRPSCHRPLLSLLSFSLSHFDINLERWSSKIF